MHFIGMSCQNIAAIKGRGKANIFFFINPKNQIVGVPYSYFVPVKIRKNMKENTSIDGTVDFGQHRVYTRPEDRMDGP
jgi:hypothetical protein